MMTGALMTILVGVAEFSSQASFISMRVLYLCKSCHTPNMGDSCYHIEMCKDSLNRDQQGYYSSNWF